MSRRTIEFSLGRVLVILGALLTTGWILSLCSIVFGLSWIEARSQIAMDLSQDSSSGTSKDSIAYAFNAIMSRERQPAVAIRSSEAPFQDKIDMLENTRQPPLEFLVDQLGATTHRHDWISAAQGFAQRHVEYHDRFREFAIARLMEDIPEKNDDPRAFPGNQDLYLRTFQLYLICESSEERVMATLKRLFGDRHMGGNTKARLLEHARRFFPEMPSPE